MDKYLSVITNFGCHYTCPYCIVRENNLHIPKTTIKGLYDIGKFAEENKCNWISISGGGDPLHNFKQNIDWYDELFYLNQGRYKLELHTSYIFQNYIYTMFNRVVYHVRNISDIKKILKYGNQKVRVVFVVTENFTKDYINEIVEEVRNNRNVDELSFRQMVDSNYKTTHYCEEYLKDGHKKDWYYITQGDYNLYYCEGKVFTKYEDLKED